jgi:Holliday junction resolvase RusA-like endonuclease
VSDDPPVRRFELKIRGEPHGQGRARAGNGRVYTPKKTRDHTARIIAQWEAAGRPTLTEGWYRMIVSSYRKRPSSHFLSDGTTLSATGKRVIYPGKPDLDNEVKALLDSLQGVGAIPDDRFLVDLLARKLYLEDNTKREHVLVTFMMAV